MVTTRAYLPSPPRAERAVAAAPRPYEARGVLLEDDPLRTAASVVLAEETPHGMLLVAVVMRESLGLLGPLLADPERAQYGSLGAARRETFAAGRVALRCAFRALGIELPAVATDDRGAPRLPDGLRGSIAHKLVPSGVLVAALASTDNTHWVGVDIEPLHPTTDDVARRILVGEEAAALAMQPLEARGSYVLERFSMKEAVYKAIDPTLRRYVGFREVQLEELAPGEFAAIAHGSWSLPLEVRARSRRVLLSPPGDENETREPFDLGYAVIATARATPRPPPT